MARREILEVQARHAVHGTQILARRHEFVIDEAERYGGHDVGANPVEHLIAGLAAASLVVLGLVGESDIADSATLRISATLNVERVMGLEESAVFDHIELCWEVESSEHADRLRAALPQVARRRPGQALLDAAAEVVEKLAVRVPTP